MRTLLSSTGLTTVCQGAQCPNVGQCWSRGTASFMILGNHCTRGCGFCAVPSGVPAAVDQEEPLLLADAIRRLGLKYVVVTSVTRDDLPDGGAIQFARSVQALRLAAPACRVELLIPDLGGDKDLLNIILEARPEVIGHNLETVRRLSPAVRSGADHDRSLGLLAACKQAGGVAVKSGLMAGMGETDEEILAALRELRDAGCDIVTIGQYLAPSKGERHTPVDRFVRPEVFDRYRQEGSAMGIRTVIAGPLVRSSYLAEEGFMQYLESISVGKR